ncbi:protein phosphatase 2C domain-containing protein [Nocardiopsis dassonvillei]|uniref:protein phosphatase 2C domain-containing protein n=1 Tax=Nocardiopsis dassonvillei TaxID=2014 RepID=UPI0036723FCA
MLTTSTASRPGGTKPNEDWVGVRGDLVVVLDGLSAPTGVGGCHHGTPWYVQRLGEQLLAQAQDTAPLRELLRTAIDRVAAQHQDCDLDDPGTPSSTVALLRVRHERTEALVLADSPVVVDTTTTGIDVLTDSRVEQVVQHEREAALAAPAGSAEKQDRLTELVRVQRQVRNTEGGYWVAQAHGDASAHALERSWPTASVLRFAVMTDGASCLVQQYQDTSWHGLLDTAEHQGVDAVLDHVRQIEASDPQGKRWPRYKKGDDATLAFGRVA